MRLLYLQMHDEEVDTQTDLLFSTSHALHHCFRPPTTLRELGDVVDLAGVAEVYLFNKGIDDEGVERLAAALEKNTSVTEIWLNSE